MTEEIIIDGVNVAGCRHLKNDGIKKPICRSGGCIGAYNSCLCKDNIDCDYKQLKRLEQENKDLKYNNNHLQVIIDDGRAENKRFREENKELKEEIKSRENELANMAEQANTRINNYRSALEEINRVIKLAHKVEDYLLGQDYTDLVDRIEKELEVLND